MNKLHQWLGAAAFSITTLSITTFSIMGLIVTLGITTFSIMDLIATLGITTFKHYELNFDTGHNNI